MSTIYIGPGVSIDTKTNAITGTTYNSKGKSVLHKPTPKPVVQHTPVAKKYASGPQVGSIEVARGVRLNTDSQGKQTVSVKIAPPDRINPRDVKDKTGKIVSVADAEGQKIAQERIQRLAGDAKKGATTLNKTQYGSQGWINGANNYLGSRQAMQGDKAYLEQVAAQAKIASTRTDFTPEQRKHAADQLAWLNSQIHTIDSSLTTTKIAPTHGTRDPDLIHPGEKVVLGVKPTEPRIVTPTEAKLTIEQRAREKAPEVAKANPKTINDPLRRLAKTDPISYAAVSLQQDHEGDDEWINALTAGLPPARREYTQSRVKEEMDKGNVKGALTVLKTNLDATGSADERKALFAVAGSPSFSETRIEKMLAALPEPDRISNVMPNLHAEQVGQWVQDVTSQGVPPEVAKTMYAVIDRSIMQTWDDKHGDVGPRFYAGLSRLVQVQDSYVNMGFEPRTQATAEWMAQRYEQASTGGVGMGVRQAVANGDAKLSLIFLNALDAKHDVDAQNAVAFEVAEGVKKAYSDWKNDDTRVQDASADIRFVLKNFTDAGDWKTANALTQKFRADYVPQAEALDAAQAALDQQSARLAQLSEDSALFLASGVPVTKTKAVQRLQAAVEEVGGDAKVLRGMQDSATLSRNVYWQGGQDDSDKLNAWIAVGAGPYAKSTRAAKNLTDFFVQQHFKVTMDQMLTDFGVDPKLDAKFADRLDKLSGQITRIAQSANLDSNKVVQLETTLRQTATHIRELSRSSTTQAERSLIQAMERDMLAIGGKDVYLPSLKKWNPTDNRVALGQALRAAAFAAYGVSLSEAMKKVAANNQWTDVVSAGAYTGSLAISGAEIAAGWKGINPAKDWALWARYVDRASPVFSAVPDAMTGVKDWQKGDYVGVGLDAGIVAANGAAFLAKLPIAAEFGAAFGPYAPLAIGAISLARAAWSVSYERIEQANRFEYPENPVVGSLVKSLGFSDAQAQQLLNQTGHGVSPMVALQQWGQSHGLSLKQQLDYLQRLTPDEMRTALVPATHNLTDHTLNPSSMRLPATAPQDTSYPLERGISLQLGKGLPPLASIQSFDMELQLQGIDLETVMRRHGPPAVRQPDSAPMVTAPAQASPQVTVHTVQPGETLWDVYGGRAGLDQAYQQGLLPAFDPQQENSHF